MPAAGDPDYTGFELRQVVVGMIIVSAFIVDEIEYHYNDDYPSQPEYAVLDLHMAHVISVTMLITHQNVYIDLQSWWLLQVHGSDVGKYIILNACVICFR